MNSFEERIIYNEISFRFAKGNSLHNGNEIHHHHEIVYFIDGDATFLSADFKEQLSKGTLLIIPKEMYHNFRIEGQNTYCRLTIWFPDSGICREALPTTMSQIRLIKNVNVNIVHLLNRMCDVMRDHKSRNAEIFLYGAFLSLLSEISFDIANATTPQQRNKEQLISKCIEYIESNYTSSLSIDDIAKELFVSTSTLFQCFKNELGVSLHKYITEKRMILARKLISQGANPTNVFEKCGFSDYSAFYKAYKKMFSVSPSKDKGISISNTLK